MDIDYEDPRTGRQFGNQEQTIKKIVLLGQTGSGKSTIGNCLLGLNPRTGFEVSPAGDSCTDETKSIQGKWCTNGSHCEITDTPGMDDSDNRDTEHIKNIIEHLKEGKFINSFVLVRTGQNRRLSKSFKSMLTIFELMFGSEFWNHVIVDVSHIKYEDEGAMTLEVNEWKKTTKRNFPKAFCYLRTGWIRRKESVNNMKQMQKQMKTLSMRLRNQKLSRLISSQESL